MSESESFYQQAHRLRDGAIMVYRRGHTKQQVYQARLKVPGVSGYIVRSLKTRDLLTALNSAEDLFYELRAEKKLGMDVRVSGNLKFKDLWKCFYAAQRAGCRSTDSDSTSSWPTNISSPSSGMGRSIGVIAPS